MGRYSIGARVSNGCEEGTITGKLKGKRRVRLDCQDVPGEGGWWRKDELEPVASATVTVGVRGPEPDGVRPEKVVNEFSIEVGKTYRTRDGRRVGPMERDGWHYVGDGVNTMMGNSSRRSLFRQRYLRDGTVYQLRTGEEQDQIVAEWVEPPPVAAPEPDIQVGDKIDYWQNGKKQDVWQGTVITALPNELGNYAGTHVVHGDGHFWPDWIRPAPVHAGDGVRYTAGGSFVAKRLIGRRGYVRSITNDTAYVAFDNGDCHTCLIENLRAIGEVPPAVALAA